MVGVQHVGFGQFKPFGTAQASAWARRCSVRTGSPVTHGADHRVAFSQQVSHEVIGEEAVRSGDEHASCHGPALVRPYMNVEVAPPARDARASWRCVSTTPVVEKVPFTTMRPGRVSMYVCGVTVYDRRHLGHARCYLAFDLIHRWLEASGYDVDYVQNFTDVDDKIIARANEARDGDWLGLVDEMIEGYYEDMDALNILRADHYPRCTEHVDGMVSIIEDLIERGHAYAADDGVYFDVSSAPEKYGQLTGQSLRCRTRRCGWTG